MAVVCYRRYGVLDVSSDTTAGSTTITNTVKINNVLVSIPVYLMDMETLKVLRKTISNSNGVFTFDKVPLNRNWIVFALDPNNAYNMACASHITT